MLLAIWVLVKSENTGHKITRKPNFSGICVPMTRKIYVTYDVLESQRYSSRDWNPAVVTDLVPLVTAGNCWDSL
jgi:hypothetical protein